MATFTIPSTLIQANTLRTTPGQTVATAIQGATITLVDTNSQWGSTPDPTRHVKVWGLQLSHDNGATWDWWLYQGDSADASLWLAFGTRDRSGGMPSLEVSSSRIIETNGNQLRLAILADAQVRLGATITTT